MPYVYPIETIWRAFGLIFDGVSVDETSRRLAQHADAHGRYPSPKTIQDWVNKGEMTDGLNWFRLREICQNVRMKKDVDKLVRKKPKAFREFVRDAQSDLDTLQDQLIQLLGEIKFKPSDLPALVEARRKLEDDETRRLAEAERITEVVGQILRASAEYALGLYKDQAAKEAVNLLLEATAEEFARFLAFGANPDTYEIGTGGTTPGDGFSPRRIGPGEA